MFTSKITCTFMKLKNSWEVKKKKKKEEEEKKISQMYSVCT